MSSWHTPVPTRRETFSELDATEGFEPVAAVATVAPERPRPVVAPPLPRIAPPVSRTAPPPPRPPRPRRRFPVALVLDVLFVAIVGAAMVFGAQALRDAIVNNAHLSTAALPSGLWWTIATTSWIPLVVVAVVLAAIYKLIFRSRTLGSRVARRGGGGLVGPIVVLLLLFALPAGAIALAADVATHPSTAPAPTDTPLDVTSPEPVPTLAPVDSPIPSTESVPAAASGVVHRSSRQAPASRSAPDTLSVPKQPRMPITPPPTTSSQGPKASAGPQSQSGGGGQHQTQ